MALARNITVTWSQRHVAWIARIDPAEKLLDATGFYELLQADCPEHKCNFDSHGRLENCFFPLHTDCIAPNYLL